MRDKNTTQLEKDLLKAITHDDLFKNLPGKVKLVNTGKKWINKWVSNCTKKFQFIMNILLITSSCSDSVIFMTHVFTDRFGYYKREKPVLTCFERVQSKKRGCVSDFAGSKYKLEIHELSEVGLSTFVLDQVYWSTSPFAVINLNRLKI